MNLPVDKQVGHIDRVATLIADVKKYLGFTALTSPVVVMCLCSEAARLCREVAESNDPDRTNPT